MDKLAVAQDLAFKALQQMLVDENHWTGRSREEIDKRLGGLPSTPESYWEYVTQAVRDTHLKRAARYLA